MYRPVRKRVVATSVLALSLAVILGLQTPLYAAGNLIGNPGFEDGLTGWTGTGWGDNDATYSITTDDARTGENAASVTIGDDYQTGDAKFIFTPVSVTPGTSYVFSSWYKSTVASTFALYDQNLSWVAWLADAPAAPTWTQKTFTIEIPDGATEVTIGQYIAAPGTLTTDDYELVTAPEPARFDEGMVTLSFDDGWKSIFTNAVPTLGNLKSTHFIYTGAVAGSYSSYMAPSDLAALAANGHEIAVHGHGHLHLNDLSQAEKEAEILDSKNYLISLGITPSTFAYPFGEGWDNEAVRTILTDAGFVGARSVVRGYNYKDTDKLALRVQSIDHTTTAAEITGWIDTAVTEKAWLILMFHEVLEDGEVCESSGGVGYAAECSLRGTLEEVVTHLDANDVRTVTVHEGLELMGAELPPADDMTAPVVTEVTPVPATTTDTTPDYTFDSTEAGTITYGGACTSATTNAVVGNNTVTFNTLPLSMYDDCTITVTDAAGNPSNLLPVTPFEIVAVAEEPIVCPPGTNDDGTGTCVPLEEEATSTPAVVTPIRTGGGALLNPDRPRTTAATDAEEQATSSTATTTVTVATTTLIRTSGSVLGVATFRFDQDLWFGTSGNDVRELQVRLKAEGFFTFETATGYFGPITKEAVIAYQKAQGLPQTGYVGPLTRGKLNQTTIDRQITQEELHRMVDLLVATGVIRSDKVGKVREALQTL